MIYTVEAAPVTPGLLLFLVPCKWTRRVSTACAALSAFESNLRSKSSN